jgi:signal transduction histidine kinase
VALVVVGRSSRPIDALHHGAQALAEGRLDTRITIKTGDELEDLASQFNAMAASLQVLYNNMAGIIDERTRELRQANQHKSEFLTHMSHELRTPLNSVIGFSDLLREEIFGPLNEKQREYVNDIHASGEHLLTLITDVLDLSKIESGHMSLDLQEVDVPALLHGMLAMMRERCLRQELSLKAEIAPDVEVWWADPRRLKQIVINLLSNAVKFTPAGGAITLQAGMDEAEGLWIEVSDTGVGIAPEHQAMIFEEFRQVGDDPLTAAQGTGLGLALVRRLVLLHGGTIRLHSRLGLGASFRFNLPRRPLA